MCLICGRFVCFSAIFQFWYFWAQAIEALQDLPETFLQKNWDQIKNQGPANTDISKWKYDFWKNGRFIAYYATFRVISGRFHVISKFYEFRIFEHKPWKYMYISENGWFWQIIPHYSVFCVDIDVFLNFVFLSISNENVYFAKMVYLWQIIAHYCTFLHDFWGFSDFWYLWEQGVESLQDP